MSDTLALLTHLPARLSLNPVVVNIEAADPDTYPDRAGLRYYCTIMVPESYLSATFVELVRLEGAETPPMPAGAGTIYLGAFFELQNHLDPLLERRAPEFNQMRISVADQLVTPYYCVLSVEYEGEEISSLTMPVEYMVKAGIDEVDYAAYKEQFFTQYIGQNHKFLTWSENPKTIYPDQPEFLYFLTNFSPAPSVIRVVCIVTYADYTEETFSPFELANVLPMAVYCVPVGPKSFGLDLKEKEVLSYKTYLTNQADERISEIREYLLFQEYRRNLRFVLYANSLGGFDTLAILGQGEEKIQLQRSLSDRFNGWEFLPSYAERVINSVTGLRELSVATGWVSKQGLRLLQELLLSKDAYLTTDRAFVPLVPTDESFSTSIDDENLIGRTLTFQYANTQTNFSALPDPDGLSKRATGWRPKATACLLDANGLRTGMLQATVLEKYYLDDNKKVVGVLLKANVPGTEGYIPPVPSSICSVTPFVNAGISRAGSYAKIGCVAPTVGGPATIVVAAGSYGSELSLADAQAKAEAAWLRLDTQDYANNYGTCVLSPELYSYSVAAGKWHYRAANPANVALHWSIYGDSRHDIGNAWMVQGLPGPYVFAMNSNDLEFPVSYESTAWRMLTFGPAGTNRRIKIWKNGTLVLNYVLAMNSDGYQYNNLCVHGSDSFTLASLDKLYISNEPA